MINRKDGGTNFKETFTEPRRKTISFGANQLLNNGGLKFPLEDWEAIFPHDTLTAWSLELRVHILHARHTSYSTVSSSKMNYTHKRTVVGKATTHFH